MTRCLGSLLTPYRTNRCQEFHQIYNYGTVTGKDEHIHYWWPPSWFCCQLL